MAYSKLDVVRRALPEIAAGDVEALIRWTTEDVEMRSAVIGAADATVYRGHDGLRRWTREREESFDEVRFSFHELREVGDLVVALGHIYAHGSASGLALDSESGWVLSVRDGRLSSMHGYLDHEAALAAAHAREK